MLVADHLVYASLLNYLHDVSVNSGIEECHSAYRSEVSIGDILGFKYQNWAAELDDGLEGLGYNSGRYVSPLPRQPHDSG